MGCGVRVGWTLDTCADLDDLDIRRIVQAWPLLECLALWRPQSLIGSEISLSRVQSLAKLKHPHTLSIPNTIRVGRREVTLPRGYYRECESPFDLYIDQLFTYSTLRFRQSSDPLLSLQLCPSLIIISGDS